MSIYKNNLVRMAMTLLMMLTMTLTASATDFITDVMVAGNQNQSQFNSLIGDLQQQGWADINQDLNQGCGSGSYYIHLLYKKQSSPGNTGTPITGFYIRTGANPPDNLTYQGRTYYLAPCQGSDNFVSGHGDLNAGCGSGSAYIFLYYTKDARVMNTGGGTITFHIGITDITFNNEQDGALGANGIGTGYDLNEGCGSGSAYIYMHVNFETGGNVVTLSSGSGNVQLQNGHILTGTGGADTQVTIADGATVTLSGVSITAIDNNENHRWPGIGCLGDAVIILDEGTTNTVKGGYYSSGIYVPVNKTLSIQGSGTLNATGFTGAAGIGGYQQSSCGNITISGGNITANGGYYAAGIGSGYQHSSCGDITISGGTVIAKGSYYAAGIGSGYQHSSCGDITISGGTVTATGDSAAAGIGGGYDHSSCGNITINDGTVNAYGNAAGIGSGNNYSSCGNITISGGTVNATSGARTPGIGSGYRQSECGHITITQGVTRVTAIKGYSSDNVIGAGVESSCQSVTIGSVETGSIGTPYYTAPDPIPHFIIFPYYIAFDANGGTGEQADAQPFMYNVAQPLWSNPFTCTGYTFDGWATTPDGPKAYDNHQTVSNLADTIATVTLYAKWILSSFPYTVAFNANGGTGTMNNQSFTYNVAQNLTANSFTRQDYYFVGWATSPDGPKVYSDGQRVSNLTQTPGATVTLYAKWIWLGNMPDELILHDGDTLTGTGGPHTHVSIADGATVTFSGVDITNILEEDDHRWPGITCLGDAVIVLAEGTTNNVRGGHISSGIYVPESKSLTIQGSGTLNVTGEGAAAGIGSYNQFSCGNITISGGNVTATGSSEGAGIGSGLESTCGDITISGGNVTANGGQYAAGIGSGLESTCGDITISGGNVTATSGSKGAGIGSGRSSSCGDITISGGTVTATSGSNGAGIGSGWASSCGDITISGGTVSATGGGAAAGIGSGYNHSSCGDITINGGTVTANGGQYAAGIGSGYSSSSCGTVTITNGVTLVTATAGQDCNNTIGAGNFYSTCGTVTIGSVETGFITQSPFTTFPYTVAFNANGGTGTMDNQSFMYNVAQNLTANSFTYSGHPFQGWANTTDGPKVYDDGQSVSNLADTIATVTLYAKWEALPSTTLPIAGYGTGNGGWHLIASPMSSSVTPTAENGFLTNAYDLYRFNQVAELEWENWKAEGTDHYHFNLESGRGYLYANQTGTTLTFSGTPYSGNGEVTLHKTTSAQFEGWNLIGNPFGTSATINKAFYRMNPETHAEIIVANDNNVAAMEGIFVIAAENNETATFTQQSSKANIGEEMIVFNLSKDNTTIDRAIIRFDEGQTLPKFQINENSTKIYIPQDGKDYAIVNAEEKGEIPVNFKTKENGTYTISVNPEGVNLAYLHLIDNMTGANIDLLQTPTGIIPPSGGAGGAYTFTAKTTDYESRFKLVFSAADNETESENNDFAFLSDGNLIINGDGMLQVVDLLGHLLISRQATSELTSSNASHFRLPTSDFSAGVYVLRLINGNDVKTQKLVIH